jgi:hypothetical protein
MDNFNSVEFSVASRDEEKSRKVESLRKNLRNRRSSLTAIEFSYVKSLVENEDDLCEENLSILEENLSNTKVFFDPDVVKAGKSPTDQHDGSSSRRGKSPTPFGSSQSVGSTQRSMKLERRRFSSSALWKQAALNVTACNRMLKATTGNDIDSSNRSSITMSIGDSYRSSGGISNNIRAIQEGASLSASDSDDEKEEKKAAEENIIATPKTKAARDDLRTRRASQNVYAGEGFEIGEEAMFQLYAKHFDPWEVTTDPEGTPFEFHVIGTTADDVDAQPHVLSPPQMQSLQPHLPFSKRGESFWLKYSLVRDGACKAAFLQHLRADQFTVMALETLDGEIFGAFTASPWNIQHGYFGTAESFVWRLKHPREEEENHDLTYEEREKRESDIEVFKFSFENNTAQICTHDRIAVGGGTVSEPRMVADGTMVEPHQFGFAISFDANNLLEATSSPCTTFNSPGLSMHHQDGSIFELLNLEVWAMTPCITVEEAQRMACHKLFLKRNMTV